MQRRAKSRPRRPRTPTSPKTKRTDEPQLRLRALYCAPHIKVPGELSVSPVLIEFHPDVRDKHVQEFGTEIYTVVLEVGDMLQCGGITMPRKDGSDLAYFLQMQTRTLNGQYFQKPEEHNDPWFVVFRLRGKEDLNAATALLLDAKQDSQSAIPSESRTAVPFPCLDCMAELEHAIHHHQLQLQLESQDRSSAASRLIGGMESLAKFLSGPSEESKESNNPSLREEPSSSLVDKVLLRLPENCSRSVLTKDLAEALLDYLPVGLRLPGLVQWVLRYTPKAHGVSLATLYRNLAERPKTVVIIQDTQDFVFGGFATAPWEPCGRFYGSGEAFVFSFGARTAPEVRFFPWSAANEYCMYADQSLLGMGGGGGRHAFVVQSDLLQGHSSPTPTFKNDVLAASEDFVLRDIEVWSLEEV